ncbi:hypothetical protein HJ129_10470 [Vibrio parahaemolyticus]|uniref:hypothetical protein n=1 Tax=Vibrio parahaemolyticus TaxID=670 RepID=UPI0015DDAED5|nr:hypothetical protein [Vibrio parahaemolyticus]MBE4028406.1 hypothetical protein [Vibrio parahaemolyticus]MBE4106611.1 hypothetical protein [Vibrio parahaemolyticus]
MKHPLETGENDALEVQHKTDFLNLLGKDIEENCQNLVIVTPVLKQEMDEIIGDYKIDLHGEF